MGSSTCNQLWLTSGYSGGTPLCRPARANDKVTNPAHPPSFTHHPTLPRLTATTVTSRTTSAGARRLRVGVLLVPWVRGACRAGAALRLRRLLSCAAAAAAASTAAPTAAFSTTAAAAVSAAFALRPAAAAVSASSTAASTAAAAATASAARRELPSPAVTLLTFSPRLFPSFTSFSSSSSATLSANRTTDLSLLHRAPGTQYERAAGAHEERGAHTVLGLGETVQTCGEQTPRLTTTSPTPNSTVSPSPPRRCRQARDRATRRNLLSRALSASSSCARLA